VLLLGGPGRSQFSPDPLDGRCIDPLGGVARRGDEGQSGERDHRARHAAGKPGQRRDRLGRKAVVSAAGAAASSPSARSMMDRPSSTTASSAVIGTRMRITLE